MRRDRPSSEGDVENEPTIAGETFLNGEGITIDRGKNRVSFRACFRGMRRTLEKPLLKDCGLSLGIYIIEMIGSSSRKMQNGQKWTTKTMTGD